MRRRSELQAPKMRVEQKQDRYISIDCDNIKYQLVDQKSYPCCWSGNSKTEPIPLKEEPYSALAENRFGRNEFQRAMREPHGYPIIGASRNNCEMWAFQRRK